MHRLVDRCSINRNEDRLLVGYDQDGTKSRFTIFSMPEKSDSKLFTMKDPSRASNRSCRRTGADVLNLQDGGSRTRAEVVNLQGGGSRTRTRVLNLQDGGSTKRAAVLNLQDAGSRTRDEVLNLKGAGYRKNSEFVNPQGLGSRTTAEVRSTQGSGSRTGAEVLAAQNGGSRIRPEVLNIQGSGTRVSDGDVSNLDAVGLCKQRFQGHEHEEPRLKITAMSDRGERNKLTNNTRRNYANLTTIQDDTNFRGPYNYTDSDSSTSSYVRKMLPLPKSSSIGSELSPGYEVSVARLRSIYAQNTQDCPKTSRRPNLRTGNPTYNTGKSRQSDSVITPSWLGATNITVGPSVGSKPYGKMKANDPKHGSMQDPILDESMSLVEQRISAIESREDWKSKRKCHGELSVRNSVGIHVAKLMFEEAKSTQSSKQSPITTLSQKPDNSPASSFSSISYNIKKREATPEVMKAVSTDKAPASRPSDFPISLTKVAGSRSPIYNQPQDTSDPNEKRSSYSKRSDKLSLLSKCSDNLSTQPDGQLFSVRKLADSYTVSASKQDSFCPVKKLAGLSASSFVQSNGDSNIQQSKKSFTSNKPVNQWLSSRNLPGKTSLQLKTPDPATVQKIVPTTPKIPGEFSYKLKDQRCSPNYNIPSYPSASKPLELPAHIKPKNQSTLLGTSNTSRKEHTESFLKNTFNPRPDSSAPVECKHIAPISHSTTSKECSLSYTSPTPANQGCEPAPRSSLPLPYTSSRAREGPSVINMISSLPHCEEEECGSFRLPHTRAEYKSFFLHFAVPRPFYKSFSFV